MIRRVGMLLAATASVWGSIWFNTNVLMPYFDGLPGFAIIVGFLVINWVASMVGTLVVLALQDLYDSGFATSLAFDLVLNEDPVEWILFNVVILFGGGLVMLLFSLSIFALSIPVWLFKKA